MQLGARRLDRLGSASADAHLDALGGQSERNRATDAPASAGHQADFARQSKIHCRAIISEDVPQAAASVCESAWSRSIGRYGLLSTASTPLVRASAGSTAAPQPVASMKRTLGQRRFTVSASSQPFMPAPMP